MGQTADEEKARNYVFRLLSYRARSIREVEDRLEKRGVTPEVGKKVVENLEQLGFLDDKAFSSSWTESRIREKSYGKCLIAWELRRKGVAQDIITRVLEKAFSDIDERELAVKLAKKRVKQLDGQSPIPSRLYGYLARRGFQSNVIMDAIEEASTGKE